LLEPLGTEYFGDGEIVVSNDNADDFDNV